MMRIKESFQNAFRNIEHSISRYPLTILFLILVAVVTAVSIEEPEVNLTRLMMTSLVGALLSVVAQTLYERFGQNITHRYLLMLASVVLTIGYYFAAGSITDYDLDIMVKTGVALFALFVAFIWIPTINNDLIPFHRNFLAAVKAFFTTLLFSVVLMIGISSIFSAIIYLLFDLNVDWLLHLLNPVYTLFGPLVFLSLTPQYQVEKSTKEDIQMIERQFTVPRFFEVLLSYIIIPLVVIYTLILVVYVLANITGDFWTNNLLEPLLVSYAVIVIIVLILSYNIENRFAVLFRKVFPKILVPIVIFQTIASILKIREMGITHGRYYVILFGLFATIAGLIFSFMKPKYHGYIAAVLLVLAAISIVPPIDAFTVSKKNQISILEETLSENDVLSGETIRPNGDLPTEDKIVITNSVSYLQNMGYVEEVSFLPDNFDMYNDFEETFGFPLTYAEEPSDGSFGGHQYVYISREDETVIEISGYDVMMRQMFYHNIGQNPQSEEEVTFAVDGEDYLFEQVLADDYYQFILRNGAGEELISYNTKDIFDDIFGESSEPEYKEVSLDSEDATFTVENDEVTLKIMLLSLENTPDFYNGEFDLLIDIK